MHFAMTCDAHGRSDDDRLQCICAEGYALEFETFWMPKALGLVFTTGPDGKPVQDRSINCVACNVGFECPEGTQQDTMAVSPGFWREYTTNTTALRCIMPEHCAGGFNSTCNGNRMGALCAVCLPGFQSNNGIDACEPCPTANNAWFQAVLFTLLIVAAVVVMYWFVLRADRDLMAEAEARDNEYHIWEDGKVPAARRGRKSNFMFKFKIIIGFLQIAFNLSFVADIPWPRMYLDFINSFQWINVDFVPWRAVGCVQPMDFYIKLVVVTLTPLTIFILLVFAYLVPVQIYLRRDYSDAQLRRRAFARLSTKFWKLILFTLFLMYPTISRKVLAFFVCRTINGDPYLVADFSLFCYTERWYGYLPLSIVMILVYPLGIPVGFWFVLRHHRKQLEEPDVLAKVGFLYAAYAPSVWWFEMADMINKLAMTSLILFLPQSSRMPVGMVWTICYMMLVLLMQPYLRKDDDGLLLLAELEIFTLVLFGFVLIEDGDGKQLSPTVDTLMSLLLIALNVLFIFLTFVFFLFNIRKWYRQRQRDKRAQAEKAERDDLGIDDTPMAFINPLFMKGGDDDDDSPWEHERERPARAIDEHDTRGEDVTAGITLAAPPEFAASSRSHGRPRALSAQARLRALVGDTVEDSDDSELEGDQPAWMSGGDDPTRGWASGGGRQRGMSRVGAEDDDGTADAYLNPLWAEPGQAQDQQGVEVQQAADDEALPQGRPRSRSARDIFAEDD